MHSLATLYCLTDRHQCFTPSFQPGADGTQTFGFSLAATPAQGLLIQLISCQASQAYESAVCCTFELILGFEAIASCSQERLSAASVNYVCLASFVRHRTCRLCSVEALRQLLMSNNVCRHVSSVTCMCPCILLEEIVLMLLL